MIQRFGSIFVNGERIGYAPDVPVRIDGEAASVKALRIGHVARVVAQRQANGTLTTNRIDAVSEVVGPIESVKGGEMTVLGQKVAWTGRENWRLDGEFINNPVDERGRYNVLAPGDLAIFEFHGRIVPNAAKLILISQMVAEDQMLHQELSARVRAWSAPCFSAWFTAG